MATFAFDTLEAQQSLTDAGVEDKQATALVDLASKSVLKNVATKEDIAELKAELKIGFANRKVEIANQNVHMMYGLLAATGVMIVAVIFL